LCNGKPCLKPTQRREAAASRRRDDFSAKSREAVLAERQTQDRGQAELGVPGGRDLRDAASLGWRGLRRALAEVVRDAKAAGPAKSPTAAGEGTGEG